MSLVFDHYPRGGGELLTALALADHADHQGQNVRPGIASLARKTRQSERTIQHHLARMRRDHWLLPVRFQRTAAPSAWVAALAGVAAAVAAEKGVAAPIELQPTARLAPGNPIVGPPPATRLTRTEKAPLASDEVAAQPPTSMMRPRGRSRLPEE